MRKVLSLSQTSHYQDVYNQETGETELHEVGCPYHYGRTCYEECMAYDKSLERRDYGIPCMRLASDAPVLAYMEARCR